ncbi:MAG: ferritin-like domain-containing protein [Deltaproteobacteria bacterium]|nr:ferritin-like domain-containing protein [Deltaproteobacteria bacterium]MBW2413432.1 ferritin-like domain-containing protein [Deltaproteobacteria bacterium]
MPVEDIVTQLTTHWQFDYEPKVKALRDLYEVAKREQWNVETDIDWTLEIDKDGDILAQEQDPTREFDVVLALPDDKRQQLAISNAAWILSQFLHGEQGALLCCGQLIESVPDIDGKLYAATQVVDEARHVEVFHKYIRRLHKVYPIDPTLQAVLNQILEADMWQMKCVGMQVIVEGLAMGAFKIMKEQSNDELLRNVVELTAQDEARHVSYGLIYMKDEIPRMSDPDRDRVEDFAYTAVEALSGRKPGTGMTTQTDLFGEVGLDVAAVAAEMIEKLQDPEFQARQPDAFRDYVMPQLTRLGIITERTAPKYRELGFQV